MRTIRCLLATAVASLLLASAAQAAPITIGSPLTAAFSSHEIHGTGTGVNIGLAEPGALTASPVNGVVLRWRILDASGGPFALRVMRPTSGDAYRGVGTSAPVFPASLETQVYETELPIQVGDVVGLDFVNESHLGVASVPAPAGTPVWVPPLAEGEERAATEPETGVEVAFNAEVQPQPTVASVSPASGSFTGGTAVTVDGTDFAGVSAVSFGGVPATSFSVGSEGSLTATAPAAAAPGAVDVTVTTVAGTSPASTADQFTYTACVVPRLKGLKLKAAKRKLRKALCKPGKVHRRKGVSAKSGHVVKQGPKPGTTRAPGAKVSLTLR